MLNPTIEAMENAIAELEGGHKALGCGSGMAAVHTILLHFYLLVITSCVQLQSTVQQLLC